MDKKNAKTLAVSSVLSLPIIFLLGGCIQLNPAGSEDLARGAVSAGTVGASDSMHPPSATVAQQARGTQPAALSAFELDRQRKVSRVFVFYGIQPGLTVLDLYSDGGYYTAQLSKVVGNSGRIVAYSERPDRVLIDSEIENPYADSDFANVEVIPSESGALNLPAGTFDMVLMVQSLHDIYAAGENIGRAAPDVASVLSEIYRSMRPGAILGIVDHIAERGAPVSTAAALHRIDPELIKRDVLAAGFLFDGESEALRNFSDDYSQPVFDPTVRGRSDRIVYRFRKPVR